MEHPVEDGKLELFIDGGIGWRTHHFKDMDPDKGWHDCVEHVSVSLPGPKGTRIEYTRQHVVLVEVHTNSDEYREQMRLYREQHDHFFQMQTELEMDPMNPFGPAREIETDIERCVTDPLGKRGCGAVRQNGLINCG